MSASRSRVTVVVLAVTLLATLVLTGCGSSEPATPASPVASVSPTAASLQRADLLAFVGSALTYVREQGKDAALARFNAKNNEFNHGELYVFAYDFTGKNLAHGYDETLVGKNLIDLTDPTGEPIIRDFIDIAKAGGGWLNYKWANPANDGKVEDKIGYIVRAGDGWLLGAGIYRPAGETPAATASP